MNNFETAIIAQTTDYFIPDNYGSMREELKVRPGVRSVRAEGASGLSKYGSGTSLRLNSVAFSTDGLERGVNYGPWEDFGLFANNYGRHTLGLDYGPYGYAKTTYDDYGKNPIIHSARGIGGANSVLILGARPTISKKAARTNKGELYTQAPVIVPGVDDYVIWEIEAETKGELAISTTNPLTITDTVPSGLELDERSILPKPNIAKGIEVQVREVVVRGTGEVEKQIQWIFTKGSKNFAVSEEKGTLIQYKTYVNEKTESGITFEETARVSFFKEAYDVSDTASVTTIDKVMSSLHKEVDKAVINSKEDKLTYTLLYRNGMNKELDYDLYDIFPYDGDYRGSKISGTKKLVDVQSSHEDVVMMYTFDERLTPPALKLEIFKTKEEWEALEKNVEDATGIYIKVNQLDALTDLQIKLVFNTYNNQADDVLYNDFGMRHISNGYPLPIQSNVVETTTKESEGDITPIGPTRPTRPPEKPKPKPDPDPDPDPIPEGIPDSEPDEIIEITPDPIPEGIPNPEPDEIIEITPDPIPEGIPIKENPKTGDIGYLLELLLLAAMGVLLSLKIKKNTANNSLWIFLKKKRVYVAVDRLQQYGQLLLRKFFGRKKSVP